MYSPDPRFTVPAVVLSALLAGYLLIGEPLLGRRMYPRLAARRGTDPQALTRFLVQTLAVQWTWVLVLTAVLLLAPGVHADDVGLRWPAGRYAGWAALMTVYLLVVIGASTWYFRRQVRKGRPVPGQQAIAAMLPATGKERALAAAVALTAGIGEELVYRGLLIAFGVGVLGLPVWLAAAAALVVFAIGHAYQGRSAAFGVTFLGAALTLIYLAGGSVLLPAIVHVAVDLRGLVAVPAPDGPAVPAPGSPAGPVPESPVPGDAAGTPAAG